jgi:hypothetical protein
MTATTPTEIAHNTQPVGHNTEPRSMKGNHTIEVAPLDEIDAVVPVTKRHRDEPGLHTGGLAPTPKRTWFLTLAMT